ncbi:MAG: DUF1294 domain-containing protein [Bacteroidota bacterium]
MIKYTFYIFILYNIYCLLLMGIDKYFAIHNIRRIPEKVLLLHAVFFGSVGVLLGIFSPLKHKRNKALFALGVPVILVLQIITIVGIFYWLIQKGIAFLT